ncbi:MAG: hypothetical protein HY698_08895 [Deltaproteobacteria bacterium]|nr:hypothetical protein [Deltaproteobacteria bacterium]
MSQRTPLDRELSKTVSLHVDQLVATISQVVRENIAIQVTEYLSSRALGSGRLAELREGRRNVRGCIAPGCSNPSKGPRFRYLCQQHKNASKKEVEAWREASRGHGAPKNGVAAAAVAGRAQSRRKVRRDMSCIAPNCKNVSKGPRFRYLCAKHLNAPKKACEAWRAARRG